MESQEGSRQIPVVLAFVAVMLTHQVGGFLGAWLGRQVIEATGSYDGMWYIDIGLGAGGRADSRADSRGKVARRGSVGLIRREIQRNSRAGNAMDCRVGD